MKFKPTVEPVVNLTDSSKNIIYNFTLEEAIARVASGDPARHGRHRRPVRRYWPSSAKMSAWPSSISRPLRFFIAKLTDGPCLIAADRIDTIHRFLKEHGLDGQFHPSYTPHGPCTSPDQGCRARRLSRSQSPASRDSLPRRREIFKRMCRHSELPTSVRLPKRSRSGCKRLRARRPYRRLLLRRHRQRRGLSGHVSRHAAPAG